ncbi:hypothetical protein PIB30_056511 [Stylosanthes scabra]|uniref:Uncharacterized protein n=1 Tax=Stylosanthes scabra TaxID=79078 RepID=A0ABU6YGS9_9FABA|nr:hypothetical protein [Stylosanthes scabra]
MVNEAHKLGYLRLEDWRLKWVTKVKSNGKLVLGYSMAQRKSRVSIELGVQGRVKGPRGSATDGSPVLVLDRLGLAIITDRVWHSFRTENPWVGDSHSVYLSDFSSTGSSLESWRSFRDGIRVSSILRMSSFPLHVLEN